MLANCSVNASFSTNVVPAVFYRGNILLVIRFIADLLRKYRGSVVIMVGRGGAETHYVHK